MALARKLPSMPVKNPAPPTGSGGTLQNPSPAPKPSGADHTNDDPYVTPTIGTPGGETNDSRKWLRPLR